MSVVQAPAHTRTDTGAVALAVLRLATGVLFLWAFVDKAFGLGYATKPENAWFAGGSPTRGFLSRVDVGPFDTVFRGIAGAWWADVLFMAGLLAIGVALVLGIGLRVAAAAGTVMMLLMWAAEWPPAQHTASGEATMSTNPVVDYHVVYALVLVAVAAAPSATWSLSPWWTKLPLVRANPWLR
ncbi:DoxX family membrane protein [Lentzea sp. NPDC003310]|uniref:DoxX family membrane protein n=1 Tax=Lentzea sp. NPDC003310 TaxID=3154447 RepID=UPI0033ABD0FA